MKWQFEHGAFTPCDSTAMPERKLAGIGFRVPGREAGSPRPSLPIRSSPEKPTMNDAVGRPASRTLRFKEKSRRFRIAGQREVQRIAEESRLGQQLLSLALMMVTMFGHH